MQYIQLLTCPICGTVFTRLLNTLTCANAHAFDIAREGYVNLLRKKLPGDTKEMLQARRAFFAYGYYALLSDTLNKLVAAYLAEELQTTAPAILDAGCGEGYYLGRLQAYLAERQVQTFCLGIDIAKDAVLMAAKRYKEAFFVVANLKERLVLADNSLQVMLNIFAPRNPEEFARVLAPQGLLLIVIPGPAHLQHLRATLHLLSIEENKQQHVIEQLATQFELLSVTPVSYELHLQTEEIAHAVMMTPNYWHLTPETREAMAVLQEITTRAEFTCLSLRRKQTV